LKVNCNPKYTVRWNTEYFHAKAPAGCTLMCCTELKTQISMIYLYVRHLLYHSNLYSLFIELTYTLFDSHNKEGVGQCAKICTSIAATFKGYTIHVHLPFGETCCLQLQGSSSQFFRNTPKFLPTYMTSQLTVLTYLLIYFMELSPS
jgi:hypothetical protein